MDAHAILHTAANTVALAPVAIPEPGPGQVLVETLYSCISPGTELRCLAGQQPDAAQWPYIPGYALTGRVIAAGPETTLATGTLVFCSGTMAASVARMWGGHVSHALQYERAVYPLPSNVDPLAAALAKLAAITYHGMRLSRPQPHEQVAVIGLGPIGQLAARLHQLSGARVVAADPLAERVPSPSKAAGRRCSSRVALPKPLLLFCQAARMWLSMPPVLRRCQRRRSLWHASYPGMMHSTLARAT
ncbi:hypothetical protein HC891_15970 [Candidatus Gracilibacteria bacterium]|nr:hypothetical protein [Candidatus Gracilibacteria bacterium]